MAPYLTELIRKEISSYEIKYSKSLDKSSSHRKNGNNHFIKGRYNHALSSYNQAILTAPLGSNELYFAFANRSAALYHLTRYSDCLIDIDCAFQHGYPIEKADKVLKRKSDCLEKLSSSPDDQNKSKSDNADLNVINCLVKPSNCNVDYKPSYLSNAVEVTQVKSKGYGIRAIDSIDCGSTILEEKAAISILSPEYYDKYCYHCFKLVDCQPFPCRNCHQVSFCSSSCSSISWNQYHSGECCYLDYFIFTAAFHYVPKIVLRILLLCGSSNCLKYHQDQQLNKISTPENPLKVIPKVTSSLTETTNQSTELDKSKKKKKKKKKQSSASVSESTNSTDGKTTINSLYQSIYSLVEHPEDSNDYKYFTLKIIIYLKDIVKHEIPDDSIDMLSDLIVKHFRSTIVNAIAIQDRLIDNSNDWTVNLGGNKVVIPQIKEIEIGCGLYLTFRYLNHSCIPNIHLAWFHGNSLKMIAIRDIKSGEEILNSYGVHYKYQLASRRKQLLRSSYYFDCACEACVTGLQPLNKAFVCPTCKGPVICDGSIVCLDCGAKDNLDVTSIMSQTEAFFGLINFDAENRSNSDDDLPRLQVTEKVLIECYNGLSTFLYKTHTEMGKLYRKLINCYLKLGLPRKAYEFSKKYLEVVKASSSGSFDIHVLNGLMVVLVCSNQYHSKIKKSSSPTSLTIKEDLDKICNQIEKLVNHLIPSQLIMYKEMIDFVQKQNN